MKRDSWEVFTECFKKGDPVFVVTNEDKVYWGTLGELDKRSPSTQLTRPGGIVHHIPWLNIRWMSHDGFPVRKLFGADGSASIDKDILAGNNQKVVEDIRDALPSSRHLKGLQFGDPFEVENVVESRLYNPGNYGPQHWCQPTEESLVLVASDGAQSILYDIPSVFVVEYAATG